MITFESIGLLVGGIGLFLLEMDLMTDGLRPAAGAALVKGMKSLTGNLRELSQGAARQRVQMRDHILDSAAHHGVTAPDELTERLRVIVRADRILYHSWRASQHLSGTDDVSLHTADDET